MRCYLFPRFDQIDWEKREITFPQSKMKGIYKETVITYSESIMQRLLEHIGGEERACIYYQIREACHD